MSRNPDYVWCEEHQKRGYHGKKEAKRAKRTHHPSEHMDEYRCEAHPGLWHIGHLPNIVRQRGTVPRRPN